MNVKLRTIFAISALVSTILPGIAEAANDYKTTVGVPNPPRNGAFVIYVSRLPLDSDDLKKSPSWNTLLGKEMDDLHAYCEAKELHGEISSSPELSHAGQLDRCDTSRYLGGKSGRVMVVYVASDPRDNDKCNPKDLPELATPIEHDRPTLMRLQLRQLLPLLDRVVVLGTNTGVCSWEWQTYSLQTEQGQVDITVRDPEKPNAGSTFTIITGATREHGFYSADVFVKGASELKYDRATKSISEKNKPKEVMLGINYLLGDVYMPSPAFWKRAFVKLFVTPKRSLDTVGIGIGLRLPGIDFLTGKTDSKGNGALAVFIGRAWSKGEKLNGMEVIEDSRRTASTRWGVSYSITTGLGFAK